MRLSGKNIFTTVLSLICLCFITSCSFVGDVVHSLLIILSTDIWEGETVSWEYKYNGSEVQYEVPNNVRTVALSAEKPVDIFMVKMNVGSTAIPAASTRYIVSTSTGEEQNIGGFLSSRSAEEENFLLEIDNWENVSGITPSGFIREDYAPARDFVPPFHEKDGSAGSARLASVVSEPMKAATTKALTVGVTKALWVDVPLDDDDNVENFTTDYQYTKRKATLQAVGKKCYIWVLNDNFSSDGIASGATINKEKAKLLAEQFDNMYELIREVFGKESDQMYDRGRLISIPDGTKVNIVVYDIKGDYTAGQNSGTFGYFWPKDYYTSESNEFYNEDTLLLSNNGKYFYIDSGFLNSAESMIYSTLAHEFQHMINFRQKYVNNGRNSSSWSNEMMSMVCEDMIQEYLGIELLDSPVNRLLTFATDYYHSGLIDWLPDDNVLFSYAGAYAFGAYLARNYGGKYLIKQIATNQYVDQDAITQALQAIGKNESFETVFRKYPQALVLDNAPKGAPSFNKSVQGIGTNSEGQNCVMRNLPLFEMSATINGKEYPFRPTLLPTNAGNRVDLRPYGFTLHEVISTDSAGTVNITFSSPVSENEKVYILVQPCNHKHQ